MSQIKASQVKELRDKTDAPMMECKKALSEAGGDLKKAEEVLRVKLGSKAGKTASRITAEGAVSIFVEGQKACILEVNCETDFVAKNDEFIEFVRNLAEKITKLPQDRLTVNDLKQVQYTDDETVEQFRANLIGKIGENISIRRFQIKRAEGSFQSYLHGSKIGVLVDLVGGHQELGKDIAMHIAAMKPKAVNASEIDSELIESEKRIAAEKAASSGKPPEIVEKMVAGAVNKYLKEVSLTGQVFVKADDGKITVGELLSKLGAKVASFELFTVGEGLEKKSENFAEEVAATKAASKN